MTLHDVLEPLKEHFFWDQKRLGMTKAQANIRINNLEQFEGTTNENMGFRGKKGQKVHHNFATPWNMHCHTFRAPDFWHHVVL